MPRLIINKYIIMINPKYARMIYYLQGHFTVL